jgi:hypothetical protein
MKIIILVLLAGGFLIYRPETLNNSAFTQKVNELKSLVPSARVSTAKVPSWSEVNNWGNHVRSQVLGAYTQIKKQDVIPGLPEEVVVDQALNGLTDQIKNLPKEQLKQVKIAFCQDVISEATRSGNGH